MAGQDNIVAILNPHYGGIGLLDYRETDDEIRFLVPAPLVDPQSAAFRSAAPALNDLAVSHRLSLAAGRGKCGVPEDFAFAIKSIATWVHAPDDDGVPDGHVVSLRFEVVARRRDAVTALRSTLVTRHDAQARTTATLFNVMPPSLVSFVRRARQFVDFADVAMSRDEASLTAVADDHFRYQPSEADRLSDGRRVDHVPALNLIDLALFVDAMAHGKAAWPDLSAEFLNYTDPRLAFDILLKRNEGAVELVQDGQPVAVIRGSQSCDS